MENDDKKMADALDTVLRGLAKKMEEIGPCGHSRGAHLAANALSAMAAKMNMPIELFIEAARCIVAHVDDGSVAAQAVTVGSDGEIVSRGDLTDLPTAIAQSNSTNKDLFMAPMPKEMQ